MYFNVMFDDFRGFSCDFRVVSRVLAQFGRCLPPLRSWLNGNGRTSSLARAIWHLDVQKYHAEIHLHYAALIL